MSDSINLNQAEKNLLTEILYNEKKTLLKHYKDTRTIDNLIDKTLGRISLHRKDEKMISLFNGIGYEDIAIGGTFESEHGEFKIPDVFNNRIKISGNWYHKSEFDPAIVTKFKGRHRGLER